MGVRCHAMQARPGIDDRDLQAGPLYAKARGLYCALAHG